MENKEREAEKIKKERKGLRYEGREQIEKYKFWHTRTVERIPKYNQRFHVYRRRCERLFTLYDLYFTN